MSSFYKFMLIALIVPALLIASLALTIFGFEFAAKIVFTLSALTSGVLLTLSYITIVGDLF